MRIHLAVSFGPLDTFSIKVSTATPAGTWRSIVRYRLVGTFYVLHKIAEWLLLLEVPAVAKGALSSYQMNTLASHGNKVRAMRRRVCVHRAYVKITVPHSMRIESALVATSAQIREFAAVRSFSDEQPSLPPRPTNYRLKNSK